MFAAKLYALIWIIFAAAVLSATATDSLSPIKLTVFGFLGSTLFFMGLIVLFPYLLDRYYESKQVIRTIRKNKKSI